MTFLMSLVLSLILISLPVIIFANLFLHMVFEHRYTTFFIKNRLYVCDSTNTCGRLFRHYQATVQDKRMLRCPHCSTSVIFSKRVKEKSWMKYHSDCPRMNYLELIKFLSDVYRIKRNRQSVEEIEFFEKYNSRKPNTEWINNITKNK